MRENTFIKLYRSMLSWEWYTDTNTKVLFLHLLLTVNFERRMYKGTMIERGQRPSSLEVLATETGLSIQQVRTALAHLESTGEITRHKNPKGTIITVQNYSAYQEATREATQEQQGINRASTGDQQLNKKDKKDKEGKKVYIPPISPADVVEAFNRICVSLPKVKTVTAAREKAIMSRNAPLTTFEEVFTAAEQSEFLSGRNGKWGGCGFDWLLKPANWQKVIEGNYAREVTPTREINRFLDYPQRKYTAEELERVGINLLEDDE